MGTDFGILVKKEVNKNQQRSMDGIDISRQRNMYDSSFAKNVYDILNGKTTDVLTYEDIKIIMDRTEGKIISSGYGVFIDRNLQIVILKPSPTVEDLTRVDYITPDSYETDFRRSNESKNKKNDLVNDVYNIEMIHILQDYLKGYRLEYQDDFQRYEEERQYIAKQLMK